MPTFSVPLSSSPMAPTTPESSKKRPDYLGHAHLPAHPSTTPVGLPPSSNGSFTPAGPPPSSLLGSSQLGSGRNLFPGHMSSHSITQSPVAKDATSSVSKSSFFHYPDNYSQVSSRSYDFRGNASAFTNASPSIGRSGHSQKNGKHIHAGETMVSEGASFGFSDISDGFRNENLQYIPADQPVDRNSIFAASLDVSGLSPRGIKRSRGGRQLTAVSDSPLARSETRRDSTIADIASTMTSKGRGADLLEDDFFLNEMNESLNDLTLKSRTCGESDFPTALREASQRLRNLWKQTYRSQSNPPTSDLQEPFSVGPQRSAPPLQKAIFIATLLLWIHHPPAAQGQQAALPNSLRKIPQSTPEVLIKWLEDYHNPWKAFILEVQQHASSPCAHYNFWDLIFTLILRGRVEDAVSLLESSNFETAETAAQDERPNGYSTEQLEWINQAVGEAVGVLQECPALKGEWHIAGNEWAMFRNTVRRALDTLTKTTKKRGDAVTSPGESLDISQPFLSQSGTSRGPVSNPMVNSPPSTVYHRLKAMYGVLLGNEPEITSSAQDWVEATVGMTIWWSGDGVYAGDLTGTRRSLKIARSQGQRSVEFDSVDAYLNRLSQSFQRATNANVEDDFQINTDNPVEIALACVFESNFEAALGFLHTWSLPVTDAVAEIATFGGWFSVPGSTSDRLMKNFDEADLMILNTFEPQQSLLRRDTIMIEYAHSALEDENLPHRWKLSLDTLARIGDDEICRGEIMEVLAKLPIDTKSQMDEILDICLRYQLLDEGYGLAENFADSVLEHSQDYGTALIYYARARARRKLKNVIDLLFSMTLVRSVAFPPRSLLDHDLQDLLSNPQKHLEEFSKIDPDAARILGTLLSGYATVRHFYDMRDGSQNAGEGDSGRLTIQRRLRLALPPLLALVQSASKTIEGVLVDEYKEPIVPMDGLIVLFGEALVYVNGDDSPLTPADCFTLLQAAENLESVGEEHRNKCEECLRSTLASYHGRTLTSSPQRLLKTMSSLTSTSSFSLVGSSLLDSQSSDEVMVDNGDERRNRHEEQSPAEGKRGWDWRAGVTKDAKEEDVLRMLRLGLAKIIAKGWSDGKGS